MIEDHLSGMKARNGTLVFVCSTCKVPPHFTFGAQAKGELVYLMICPKCGCMLGEWDSLETRGNELRDFAKTLKVHNVGAI
jgi:transcription initiation factor IIE alpha subunit